MEDFSLQGEVYLGASNNGKPGALKWVNDAGVLQLATTSSEETRNESWSGKRHLSATINTGIEVTFTLTLRHGSASNLALGLYGDINTVSAGSTTAETFPNNLQAGDIVALDRANISELSIIDSANNAAHLTEGTHYNIRDAVAGLIEIIDPSSLTQPFMASYSYGASQDVVMFSQTSPICYLMMNGRNTVDGSNDRLRVRMYRLKFNPIEQLDLINDSFGELQLTGTALLDSSADIDPTLGGYGRIELLEASA